MSPVEVAATNAFLKAMFELTVYVVGCDARDRPLESWGSGLLWERGDTLTLLTVAHNFKVKPTRLDPRLPSAKGSLLIELPERPGWMATAKLDAGGGDIREARDLDFAWANYDLPTLRAKLEANPHGVAVPPFRAIRQEPTRTPDTDRPYGFAAAVATAYDPRNLELHTRDVFEAWMTFDGVHANGDFSGCYRFKLARPHQGHAYYKGSSGAPVADEEGHPVGLVAGGDAAGNVVFATPLQPFVRYLDL